jgi:hypothetical protein
MDSTMSRPKTVHVRSYNRTRLGRPEFVHEHWRSPPRHQYELDV